VAGIFNDTRKAVRGGVYVAIRGDHFDGHDFVAQALVQGAVAALVSDSKVQGENLLFCDDTVKALAKLASYYRGEFTQPVIAITGSNGKTTTKEFLAHVLSRAGNVIATQGNLNNHIGVPLTIFSFDKAARFFIVEMGMSHLGEIGELARMTRPDIGMITSVGHAHLEGVGGSLVGVAKAKGELFEELNEKSLAVVNGDDDNIRDLKTRARRLTYGLKSNADMRGENIRVESDRTFFDIVKNGEKVAVSIGLVGLHHVRNALSVFAVASELGLSTSEIVTGLESFAMKLNRGCDILCGEDIVIDDTYNANPDSMKAAFQSLCERFPNRYKTAILGCMLELGAEALRLHQEVGAFAKKVGIQDVYAYGPMADAMIQGFCGDQSNRVFTDHDSLACRLYAEQKKNPGKASVILFKGSRGMAMEKALQSFLSLAGVKK
jgi:UDP-N-acetylmuramoyl-tripeptide--D-alanyl-D-alanine ligase